MNSFRNKKGLVLNKEMLQVYRNLILFILPQHRDLETVETVPFICFLKN